jgi:hypothetical protein
MYSAELADAEAVLTTFTVKDIPGSRLGRHWEGQARPHSKQPRGEHGSSELSAGAMAARICRDSNSE